MRKINKYQIIGIVGIVAILIFLLWFSTGGNDKLTEHDVQQFEKLLDNM